MSDVICCHFCDPLGVDRGSLNYLQCTECSLFLCEKCYKSHQESCTTVKDQKFHVCKEHNSFVNGYCFSCSILICKQCRRKNHLSCKQNIVTIYDAFFNVEREINSRIQELDLQITKVDSALRLLKGQIRNVCSVKEHDEYSVELIKYNISTLETEGSDTKNHLTELKALKCQLVEAKTNLEYINGEKNPLLFLGLWKNPNEVMTSVVKVLNDYQGIPEKGGDIQHEKQNAGRKSSIEVDGSDLGKPASSTGNLSIDNELTTKTIESKTDDTPDISVLQYEKKYILRTSECLRECIEKIEKVRESCGTIVLPRRGNTAVDTFTDRIELAYNYIIKQKNRVLELEHELRKKNAEVQTLREPTWSFSSLFSSSVKSKQDTLQRRLEDVTVENSRLIAALVEKERLLEKEKQEKDELQSRLSSFAGERLTKGNFTITNLGDPNRPMNIGDRYSELYDNEWTDSMELAKEMCPNDDYEEAAVNHLCKIVVECYRECKKISILQLEAFGYTSCTADKAAMETSKEENNIRDVEGEFGVSKTYFDTARRHRAEAFVKWLLENKKLSRSIQEGLQNWDYASKSDLLMQKLMDSPFFEKCAHLCWYMVIQDPMMYLDDEIETDSKFDNLSYKEFVQKGDRVKFVVWPALYLYKGGAVMKKGVVQAYSPEME